MQNLLLYDMPASDFYHSVDTTPSTTTTTTTAAIPTTNTGIAFANVSSSTYTQVQNDTYNNNDYSISSNYNNNNNGPWSLWELTTTALSSTLATFSESLANNLNSSSSSSSSNNRSGVAVDANVNVHVDSEIKSEMEVGTFQTLAPAIGRRLQQLLDVTASVTYNTTNINDSNYNNNDSNNIYSMNGSSTSSGSGSSSSSSLNQSIAALMNVIAANTTNSYYNNIGNNITLYNTYNNNHNNNSTHNHSITEIPYVPYVMRPETYIVPVLFALIFIVGVLGNGTLIVVFLSVRQMRNVPNTYILSLALADLLVIVTTVPLTSTVYTVDTWPWGSFLCTLSEFIKDVSIGVSVFTLTALSADRYFAIVDPLRKFHAHGGGKRATRMTIAIAVSIWILAMICGLPALLGTYIKEIKINSDKSFAICYPFPEKWGKPYAKTMVLLRFLVYYAIPLIIIGAFYVLIACHLMYSANVPGEMQGAVRQVRARRKVAVTVLAFVVIFGICFLPSHVFMLWFYYWPTAEEDYNSFWHVLRILGFCLSFANSCANPVALYFVSGAFRKHFNRYLFCQDGGPGHKKRHHQHNDTLCMHRDVSLTSTNASTKRCYHSRRSHHNHSTIRSRLAETTITMMPNGNHADCPSGCHISSQSEVTAVAVAITDKPLMRRESKQQRLKQQHDEAFM